ncbi:hypothetical protein [Anaerosolibacter carboniphilus]|uniref:hypothetical protein n=1 Tax=Anaerosolibacter carboniphilus TaxID=1417629 RepID=UPI001A9C2074|nr:hypothetical protein [Anaerosolibacter carboniphilus]
MALGILDDLADYQKASPWNAVRRTEWRNIIQLKDLFESESLEAFYREFIDQRYIDYLYRNFDDIYPTRERLKATEKVSIRGKSLSLSFRAQRRIQYLKALETLHFTMFHSE